MPAQRGKIVPILTVEEKGTDRFLFNLETKAAHPF
jgi:hypothetical protein